MSKFVFKGGVYIPNPYPIKNNKIEQIELPKKVVLPLQQLFGGQSTPCVGISDRVLTGQVIAKSDNRYSVPIHASISGMVTNIYNHPIVHRSGINVRCMVIESDGKDQNITTEDRESNFLDYEPSAIIDKIKQAGVVGVGGAGFPTHIKIARAQGSHILIVNVTECDPGIMCDDALIREYSKQVMIGVEVLLHICGAKRAIIVIEDDKPEAFELLLMHNVDSRISIQKIPTKYGSGSEKILLKVLLGIEIGSGKYATEYGVLCQNVGTVKAVYDAVVENKPFISRVVTISGPGVNQPKNYELRLGTQFTDIIRKFSVNDSKYTLRIGGMMGIDIANFDCSVDKTTNCIFINNEQSDKEVKECIRCGMCHTVCPIGLLPQQLYWHAKSKNIDKAIDYNLRDCIECECCTYICPSNIPLVKYFNFAKALSKQQTSKAHKVDIARERFEYKEIRIERNKRERVKMMAVKKQLLKEKMAKETTQKDKIAAAVTRVNKAKKDE